jgi:hypothetical protein
MKKPVLLLPILALAGGAWAQSVSLPTDRGRVTVARVADPLGGPSLKVLRTDAKTPLRAGTAWLWSKEWQEEPAEYYAMMRGKGLNAVRIVLFDTWEKEAGYGATNWEDAAYRKVAMARIERAVNYCSQNGLYAIINSHNKIPEFDVAYNQALWKYVAPEFRNRTHVLYEVDNEALSGTGINGTGQYADPIQRLQDLRDTFSLVRQKAPNTHVMVLTPSGVSGWGFVDGMARMTAKFVSLPGATIDWTKTSVAYHLYHGDANLFPKAENLRNFHAKYPGWPSENNFPGTVTAAQLGADPSDTWRSVSFGSDLYVNQTCERLGLGWSHWHINRAEKLERNFPLLWADAVAKGYAWTPDPVMNDIRAVNVGGGVAGAFAPDINYCGGTVATNNPTGAVDTKGVANAAPADVYRSERWRDFTYEFARLTPGTKYTFRLHFAESYGGITAAGQRLFNIYANTNTVKKNFDIFATAGKRRNRAVVLTGSTTADRTGRIRFRFESVVQSAKVDGIEILVK